MVMASTIGPRGGRRRWGRRGEGDAGRPGSSISLPREAEEEEEDNDWGGLARRREDLGGVGGLVVGGGGLVVVGGGFVVVGGRGLVLGFFDWRGLGLGRPGERGKGLVGGVGGVEAVLVLLLGGLLGVVGLGLGGLGLVAAPSVVVVVAAGLGGLGLFGALLVADRGNGAPGLLLEPGLLVLVALTASATAESVASGSRLRMPKVSMVSGTSEIVSARSRSPFFFPWPFFFPNWAFSDR